MQEKVSFAVEVGIPIMKHGESITEEHAERNCGLVPRSLDIMLYLCKMGHVEGGLIV